MTLVTNENFQRLVDHLKAQGEAACLRSESTDEYQRFIQKFPLAHLSHLSPDQYCVGKGDGASFCWWIEQGLIPALGRYMPGTSRGHILYFLGDGTLYKNRRLLDLSDEEALRYTLKIQSVIAGADPSDLRWVDDDKEIYRRAGVEPRVTVGNGRKLRLLACYLPAQTLPISSSDHLGHYLKALGSTDANIPSVNKPVARMLKLREYYELACESVPGLSPYGFMRGLYSNELGLAPVKADQADDDEQDTSSPHAEASKEAMHMDLQGVPLNQILFGPPGTGKTHATVDHALAILDPDLLSACQDDIEHGRKRLKSRFDELVQQERIRFVTFHQSFSYEDFVEGLRAESDDDSGQLRYEVVDGVFKSLCEAAAAKVTQQAEAPVDVGKRRIWKMSLGNTLGSDAGVYEECVQGGYVLLGYGGGIDFSGCSSRGDVQQRFVEAGVTLDGPNDYSVTSVTAFVTKMKPGDLVVVSDGNFKFRAIGEVAGDYAFKTHPEYDPHYSQMRPVKWLRQYSPSLPHGELLNGQFSQMTLYELRSPTLNREKLQGLLGAPALSGVFLPGQTFGRDYQVIRATSELLELKKPNGNVLGFSMSLINELAEAVRSQKIALQDIRDKTAIEKLPGSTLEPFLVNGYNSILAVLVGHLTGTEGHKPATEADVNARVLIIDEINRGNISRIFGELITLIETSKRAGAEEALSVVLPYSKQSFSVPKNVYLIGTMNTADRSLAGLDIALRRRFVFREMPPRPELLDRVEVQGLNIGLLLRVMNQRIEVLLDREHCLGHAYFMPLKTDSSLARLELIFRNQVLPLLQEYFFADWQRIQWVLNDHRKPAMDRFVEQDKQDLAALFGNISVPAQGGVWRINDAAFKRITAYTGVIAVKPAIDVPARELEEADA